jgi:hypothetical protein
MEGGVSEGRASSPQQRRLEELGFTLEITPAGKHYWRVPETGQRVSPSGAVELLKQREEQRLREAGWKPVEVEGERYWRRPDSGRLYPQGSAYDLVRTMEEGE